MDTGWAVVDVETTGLYPSGSRVLSVAALPLDASGKPDGEPFVSLVDPGIDPGAVHIHGLTREKLAGSPRYPDIVAGLHDVLRGRILVAHNASFDHSFLAAEASRAGTELPVAQRLCTVALSRRLGIDVPNHQLGTVAGYWGVVQEQAHDAHDDARVLAGILSPSLALAAELGLPLPIVGCDGARGRVFPARIVKSPCPWRYPGRLTPGGPLVQGMKIAVTGDTRTPRETLVDQLSSAGIDVMGSVSRITSGLVANARHTRSRKLERARAEGTPLLSEDELLALLADVRPGEPKADKPKAATRTARPAPVRGGPLAGRRVLVLGGTHADAALVRGEVSERGGAAAVNLSATVTDVVLLAGGDLDRRMPRVLASGVGVHTGEVALGIPLPSIVEAGSGLDRTASAAPRTSVAPVLPRGGVLDLPDESLWSVDVAWRAGCDLEVDVVAFIVDATERVQDDEDFVFYNQPVTPEGAVALSVDGDSEQGLRIDLDLVGEQSTKIVVAAALGGDATFGELGAVTIAVDGAEETVATATLDAGTTERTMLLAEIYRRGDVWRVRAMGQGYDHGLAELATSYGVVVG
ncbi:MAG: hypothetical protein ABS81_13375 [Pseudonocardia sp. SCN 72-86]|nr:MAG: hypothetical protein ABS81_13375 [Pseudonocardia sp. SCN 72-86]